MQLIAKGLDYSARSIPALAIKNASYDFVIRYVGFPGNKKCITPTEYKDLIANGIRVYAVYEFDTNDSMGGYAGGVNAAHKARADMDRIGFPANAICFFCADRHLANWEIPVSQQYINGAASVFGWDKTGAYGFQEFIWAIQKDDNCKYLWQCGAQSYVREGVHFYQWNNGRDYVDDVECDINMQFIPVTSGSNAGGGGEQILDATQNAKLEDLHEWILSIYSYGWLPVPSDAQRENRRFTGGNLGWFNEQVRGAVADDLNEIKQTLHALMQAIGSLQTGTGVPVSDLVKAINDDADLRDRDDNPGTGIPPTRS